MFLFIFILSCTPVNLSKQSKPSKEYQIKKEVKLKTIEKPKENNIKNVTKSIESKNETILQKNITILFSKDQREKLTNQFVNVLELATYQKNLKNITLEIKIFEDLDDLENIISNKNRASNIFIGPIETRYTNFVKRYCDEEKIFFAFSSDVSLANDCIYLINFFPKNELEELFFSLDKDSKVALLFPENNYGYLINSLIDEIIDKTDVVLVNRSSYKNDLSNVRDAIKELGKYELRKYELTRQKKILSTKNDEKSKKRLKKLEKFKTTSDYDFTHILVADYGLNLLQVAPLLPYYDIDPKIVQFVGTGVIDDENFFYEPSLQGTIFPGIQKSKRQKLLDEYKKIYEENLLRISTLPYDLVGLIDYIYSKNMSIRQVQEFLNNSKIMFDGVDGEFYFKNNMIERDLDILKISNGSAIKIN